MPTKFTNSQYILSFSLLIPMHIVIIIYLYKCICISHTKILILIIQFSTASYTTTIETLHLTQLLFFLSAPPSIQQNTLLRDHTTSN